MRRKPKIGTKELCNLLGVTPSTIRLYERFLQDRRYQVSDSGHRVFSGASLTQLFDLRFMAKGGLSLEEAANVCQDTNAAGRVAALVRGERELARQMLYLQASLEEIRGVKDLVESVDGRRSQFSFLDVPGFFFLECERNGQIVSDPETLLLMEEWTEMIPAVYLLNRDVPEDAGGYEWSFRMGLAIAERNASLVTVDHKAVRHVPSRRCLVGIVVDEGAESLSDSEGYRFSGKVLGFARRYCEQHGLKLSGQVFHRSIASMLHIEDPEGGQVTGDLWYGIYPVV